MNNLGLDVVDDLFQIMQSSWFNPGHQSRNRRFNLDLGASVNRQIAAKLFDEVL